MVSLNASPILLDFYFMRHAESTANQNRIASGSGSDSRLTETGLGQAELAADFLEKAEPRISAVYHTRMYRAFESAAPLQRRIGIELREHGAFDEQMLGEWEGTSWDRVGELFASGEDPPGGESYRVFHSRVLEGLRELSEAQSVDGEIPLVVSHGGVWMAIHAICGEHAEDWPENCDIYRAKITGSWDSPRLEAEPVFRLPPAPEPDTLMNN